MQDEPVPVLPSPVFVGRPSAGRVVGVTRHVGLADVRPDSTVRLDAIARFMQDVADHDAYTAALEDSGVWLLRRFAMRIAHTPRFRADLELETWCSGVGARWAERRTDVTFGAMTCIEGAGLWVHVDPERGVPLPRPSGFDELWGVSANGRKVRPSLHHPPPAPGAAVASWPLRATDLDVIGHVNNAAYWAPAEEELARRGDPRVTAAEIEFRSGLDRDDPVEVHTIATRDGFMQWCCVAGDVRASLLVVCGA